MEKRPSTYLRCYIPGYTSNDGSSQRRSKRPRYRTSMWKRLQHSFENKWQNLMKDATREVYGGLALLGILCLNAGIFLMVCRSKRLITEEVSSQIAIIAGPLIIFLGLSLFVLSVIVYKRKRRRKNVCWCNKDQEEETIPYYTDNECMQYLDGGSLPPSYTQVNPTGPDEEEIRSAFRKFSRDFDGQNYSFYNYSLPYSSQEIPFEILHCQLCTDYSQNVIKNGYLNDCGCLYCTDWTQCVDYRVPQVTLV